MPLRLIQRCLLLLLSLMLLTTCTQKLIENKIRNSRLIILVLPQYDTPLGAGNSSQTPDDRLGEINEFDFWYEYVYFIKQSIEQAGYSCLIVNHGSIPSDTRLLPYSELSDIVHLDSSQPDKPTHSTHYPELQSVAMSSLNYALEQNPACIVLLRHHEYDEKDGWSPEQESSVYCNQYGGTLASYIAQVLNRRLLNNALRNGGSYCGILLRRDPSKRDTQLLLNCEKSNIPAVATAITYLNNPDHVRFISQHKNAVYYAQCIASGIINYMNAR